MNKIKFTALLPKEKNVAIFDFEITIELDYREMHTQNIIKDFHIPIRFLVKK